MINKITQLSHSNMTELNHNNIIISFPLQDGVWCAASKRAPCLTSTSLSLKQESDSWDPKDNTIVQVTRKMADTICYMTQYLRKKGPIPVMTTRGHFSAWILTFADTHTHNHFLFSSRIKRLLSLRPKM